MKGKPKRHGLSPRPYIGIGQELVSITSINHETSEIKGVRCGKEFTTFMTQENTWTSTGDYGVKFIPNEKQT